MPNFTTGASIISGTPGLLENGGIPNITGTANFVGSNSSKGWWSNISGALTTQAGVGSNKIIFYNQDTVTHNDLTILKLDASIVSSVYNNSQKVFASGVKAKICIKY